ncbi:hypothetical protein BH23ACT9_BH23ACT9_16140 [soil metagenome]
MQPVTAQSDADEPGAPHAHGIGGSPECQLCPVCVVLQAVGTSRPDVTAHLLAAARELALAVKSVAEGHGEASDRAQAVVNDRLTRINID